MTIYAVYKLTKENFEQYQPQTIDANFIKKMKNMNDENIQPIGYCSNLDKACHTLILFGFRIFDFINTIHGKYYCNLTTFINGKGDIIMIFPLKIDDGFSYLRTKPEFDIIKVCDLYRITNRSNNTTICLNGKEFEELRKELSTIKVN